MPEAVKVQPLNKPADLSTHEADKVARAKAREKKRNAQLECLDPEMAAQYESRKALYEWKIEIAYMKPKERGGFEKTPLADQVVAKTETDAWALFCDKNGITCGPKACLKRVITRLNKRTIESSDD